MTTFKNRTPDEFKTAAATYGIRRWDTRRCSICDEPIGFVFQDNQVLFDGSCGCSTLYHPSPQNWQAVADTYNGQASNPFQRQENEQFWHFDTEYRKEYVQYGLGVIKTERERQVQQHAWEPEHDDLHVNGELVLYAEYWLTRPEEVERREEIRRTLAATGTEGWEDIWFKYDERTPEQRLARGGALVAAEIDRLKRIEGRINVGLNKQPGELS